MNKQRIRNTWIVTFFLLSFTLGVISSVVLNDGIKVSIVVVGMVVIFFIQTGKNE